MKCPGCQHDNPEGATFCGECGTRLAAVCPSCGMANVPTNKFCHSCGTRIAPAATPAAAPAPTPPPAPAAAVPGRFADPHAYTPKHLAEKILTSKAAIVGERKQVTVLFADVSGSTAMSERLDPEDVHGIMDRMFEVILAAVHRHEGTVNQFLGDGCMALFGAPIAHEDHAHRAIRAALAIQHDLAALRADVARLHGVEFRLRVGINTGPVVVGAIGRDLRMDYTAVGDTTNLAARLLNIATPGQIVVSGHTRLLTEGYFVFDDLGDFTVKGKAAPVRASAVVEERRGRTRLEVSRDRGLTPLAGRAVERERLHAAFERAANAEGAAVWLSGEPGVGKSRLLYEFMRSLDETGALQVEANCPSYGRSIPYHPILAIVRSFAHIDETTPAPAVEERVGELLLRLGIDDEEAEALLAHFLGLAVTSEFLVRLQGVTRN
jgi:class 3 adenylate cyclase